MKKCNIIKKNVDVQLYRCVLPRSMAVDRGIIWRDQNIDEEIARFKDNYERWSKVHPDRVKMFSTGVNKTRRQATASDYIGRFLAHIDEILETSDKLNWPWEWCIDDLTDDGKFFNPNWVIFGDSRIYSLSRGKFLNYSQEKKKGKGCKTTTRLNNRFYRHNDYCNDCKLVATQIVCNYFSKKPSVSENVTLEAGHIYQFDATKPWTFNDNILNVQWQSSDDNRRIQVMMDHGNIEKVLDRERERFPEVDIQMDETITAMIKGITDPRVNAAIRFVRDDEKKPGMISAIQILQDRGIEPVDRNGKPIIQEEKPLPEVTKTKSKDAARLGGFDSVGSKDDDKEPNCEEDGGEETAV